VKVLTAIIRPGRLSAVLAALDRANFSRVTVTQALGRGSEPALSGFYRGTRVDLRFRERLRLEIVLADAQVDRAVAAIRTAAATNTPGDGNIWIQPVADFVRIRDGARGGDALMPAGLPETIP